MENVAIVQPTPQLKSKEYYMRKNSLQKLSQSPTKSTGVESIYALQKKIKEVPPYRDPPGVTSPPLRTLPPYRDPPPPNISSPGRSQHISSTSGSTQIIKEDQSSPNHVKLKRNLIQVS